MYNTKSATTVNEEFDSSYMPVGINENVLLKEISVEKSPTQKDFLRITFEDQNGKTAEFTEWKNEKNMYIKTDEELQKRDNTQFGRLLLLFDCFFETRPEVEINSFSEMINWVKNTLTPLIETKKKLRLKVIYDNKGFIRVSPNGVYVEPMDVTESKIKMFKKDNIERKIQADIEPKNDPLVSVANESQLLNTPVTSVGDVNELPF